MPGKSGRSKRKHPPLGKKKVRRLTPAAAVPESPVASPGVPAQAKAVSPPSVLAAPAQYNYIYSELWRIGILAVIILAILVVLSLVIS